MAAINGANILHEKYFFSFYFLEWNFVFILDFQHCTHKSSSEDWPASVLVPSVILVFGNYCYWDVALKNIFFFPYLTQCLYFTVKFYAFHLSSIKLNTNIHLNVENANPHMYTHACTMYMYIHIPNLLKKSVASRTIFVFENDLQDYYDFIFNFSSKHIVIFFLEF